MFNLYGLNSPLLAAKQYRRCGFYPSGTGEPHMFASWCPKGRRRTYHSYPVSLLRGSLFSSQQKKQQQVT